MSTIIPSDNTDFANYLTTGFWQDVGYSTRSWSQNNVTYNIQNTYSPDQKAGIKLAFDLWSDVADISFSETSGNANIAFTQNSNGSAYSSSSVFNRSMISSEISIDTTVASGNIWSDFNDMGNYAMLTAIHEIGHSLGLGHSGNYNGSASYANDAQWASDTHQYSVMSYFNVSNVGSDHRDVNGAFHYPASPMLIDILAIQDIYGADFGTRSGDTTYGFNSTADRPQFDFTIGQVPVAIWDGAGEDTIDLSGYSTNQTIYLTQGDYSSTGHMTNNLVIAYGAQIENAIGGAGTDTIYGNAQENVIRGGSGGDQLYASLGSDLLDGEAGTDTIIYESAITNFTVNLIDSVSLAFTSLVDGFTDTIQNIENFIFGAESFTLNEIQSTYAAIDPIDFWMYFDNGSSQYKSTLNETKTFTAADIGITTNTNDQITLERLDDTINFNVEDNHTLNILTIKSTENADTINITGDPSTLLKVKIFGYNGNDTINIEIDGSDYIATYDGDDIVNAGAGTDRIIAGNGEDVLNGEDGNDKIYGQNNNDTISGGNGADYLDGGEGEDLVQGGAGSDYVIGRNGNDMLYGDDARDYIYGGNGDDVLNGGNGNDYLNAGDGNDELYGEDGSDRLLAHGGNDLLVGGAGRDFLYGYDGQDVLIGGAGADYMNGGAGRDTFIFDTLDGSVDAIHSFDLIGANSDILNITDILTGFGANDDINDFLTLATFGTNRVDLSINADGIGTDFEKFAIIRGADFTNTTLEDLITAGQLVTDSSL